MLKYFTAQLVRAVIFLYAATVCIQTCELLAVEEKGCVRFSKTERTAPDFAARQFVNLRGSLKNSFLKFSAGKSARVAFVGGSITEMRGWRNMVQTVLKERFPRTQFDFIDAGISSTGSTPGAFRMKNDVLSKGAIDLLFIENAVNDDTNKFTPTAQIRGMEGEIRGVLSANANTDIVVLHFIYDPFIGIENRGDSPEVIKNHEFVCAHYEVPSINLCREIALRMRDGQFDWKKFGGTHPAPFGHKFYAAAVENLFDKMWSDIPANSVSAAHALPEVLDKFSYYNGRFENISAAKIKSGWQLRQNWKPAPLFENIKSDSKADTLYSFDGGVGKAIRAGTRKGFVNVPMLEAREVGAELSLDFKGRAVGIFCVSGPASGTLEYSVDGAPFKSLDTFTPWSRSLYLPWVYMFETELSDTSHRLVLRMSAEKNKKSLGHECQIRNFVVN